jgi:hypothetical protein
MDTVLANVAIVIAQNSQEAPEEGTGIGLILLGVLIAAAVAVGIFLIFTRMSKKASTGAPGAEPHDPGHVGVADPPDARTGARIDPSRRGVEQSGSSSGS